jgi:TolB-like protein/DNA-binding winged helix-turn-helix (wHTH) protein/Flp pilus assembly protein TadD
VAREIYEIGDFRLDPAHRRLEGPGGAPIALTAKPFDALVHLVGHAGELVSRKALLEALWPDTIVEDNNLTQAIHSLRSVLGKEHIVTLPGRGYQFVGHVSVLMPDSDAADPADPNADVDAVDPVLRDPPDSGTASPPAYHRGLLAGAAVTAVALFAFVVLPGLDGDTPDAASSVLPNSIAVLPLVNLSPDPDNAYYAAGLHEEVLNQLSRLGSLNVISRASVLRYAADRPPIPDIGTELNVQKVLEGSVRFAGGRIRVAMQLSDAQSNRQIWAETYDSDFGDVFAVQADIATNVAHAMSLEFSAEERRNLLDLPTGSSEAYALYLRAWNTGAMAPLDTRDDALLDQAISLDPDFALAHALKSLVQARRLVNLLGVEAVDPEDRAETEATIRRHATRAIEIDPNVPYAHVALGNLYQYQWHWTDAIAEYRKAVNAMPSDLSARQSLAWLLGWLGRHPEAIEQARAGIDLNPMSANALFYIAPSYAYAGDYGSAIEVMRRAQPLFPGNPVIQAWLGFMETARRNTEVAVRELRRAEELMGGSPSTVFLPEFAYAYSLLGLDDDVNRLYAQVLARAETDDSLGAGTWAQTFLAVGDHERALEWLDVVADRAEDHVIDEAALNVLHLKMNYMNDPVLHEPRFVEVFSRIQGD